MTKFTASIYKIGINPVVDLPENVLAAVFEQAGRSKGPIPVHGRIDGAEFTQTLVKYQGAWRLYINGPMLKNSDLKVGDTTKIEIEFDARPRDVPMPKELKVAFQKNAEAEGAYAALSPFRQKEINRYLASLKSDEAVQRNIERVLKQLTAAKQ